MWGGVGEKGNRERFRGSEFLHTRLTSDSESPLPRSASMLQMHSDMPSKSTLTCDLHRVS